MMIFRKFTHFSAIAIALTVFLLTALTAANAQAPASAMKTQGQVTFTKDVAPILQEKCQTCHRVGEIGPMPLTTYQEVRPYAKVIKQRVVARTMPLGS